MVVQDALRGFADRQDRGGGPLPTERSSTPPRDTGERLLTLGRGDAGDEFRISIDELGGRRFVSMRIWERSSDGSMWPSKRGVTVRAHELVDFSSAIATAVQRLGVGKGDE